MILSLVQIADRGVPNKERLHFAVGADGDLVSTIVLQSYFVPRTTNVRNIPDNTYWFPPQPVKKGDAVVLYTRAGTSTAQMKTDGRTIYFYFWNKPSTIFNDDDACAILVSITDYQVSPRPAPELEPSPDPSSNAPATSATSESA